MSENKGRMDSVQSYDSEIATAGAMQKTISPTGAGEFPKQVAKFKSMNSGLYKVLFENCGWYVDGTVASATMHYIDPETNIKYEGKKLKSYIRQYKGGKKNTSNRTRVESRVLASLVIAIQHEEYLKLQVIDFIDRLKNALNKKPTGYNRKINEYVKSNLGKAVVLDQDINRPGNVSNAFGDSLNDLYAAYPNLSKDPSTWTEQNEKDLLEIYGPKRGEGNYTMTNARQRYMALKRKL